MIRLDFCHGEYFLTEDGRVLRAEHSKLNARGQVRRYNAKEMALSTDQDGYLFLLLPCVGGRRRKFFLHRLLAEAFLGAGEGRVVNHRDGNKRNNSVSNLEWCTAGENVQHAWTTGLMGTAGHHLRRLSDADVRQIRELYATGGHRQIDLAKRFNVGQTTISDLVRNSTWKEGGNERD